VSKQSPPGTETELDSKVAADAGIPNLGLPLAKAARDTYTPCPHCGSVTIVEPSRSLWHQCGICGKARVPVLKGLEQRPPKEIRLLAEATKESRKALFWGSSLSVSTGFSVLSTMFFVFLLKVFGISLALGLFGMGTVVFPILFAMMAWSRRKSAKKSRDTLLEQGWTTMVRNVLEQQEQATIDELSDKLQLTPQVTEKILIRAAAEGFARSDFNEDGEIVFLPAVPKKVRIATGSASSNASIAADQDEMWEQMAKEEAEELAAQAQLKTKQIP
jgi:hypothetical protein